MPVDYSALVELQPRSPTSRPLLLNFIFRGRRMPQPWARMMLPTWWSSLAVTQEFSTCASDLTEHIWVHQGYLEVSRVYLLWPGTPV